MSFVNMLKPEELTMLRRIVKKVHFQHFDEKHGKSFVTNKMIDNVIDNIGPDVAETMVKFGVDKGLRWLTLNINQMEKCLNLLWRTALSFVAFAALLVLVSLLVAALKYLDAPSNNRRDRMDCVKADGLSFETPTHS